MKKNTAKEKTKNENMSYKQSPGSNENLLQNILPHSLVIFFLRNLKEICAQENSAFMIYFDKRDGGNHMKRIQINQLETGGNDERCVKIDNF